MLKKLISLRLFVDIEPKKPLDLISVGLAIFVFAVLLLRAWCFDIQYDEAYSYLNTGRIQDVWKVYQFRIANTHLLNSLAMTITTLFFPYNDFMIRLPNIIASVLYLLTAISLSKQYKNRFILLSGLLFFHFMLEFMAQGRGYGMSATFLLMSFYVYKRQDLFRDHYRWIAILLLLAFYANYIALFPAAAFVFINWVQDLKYKAPPFSKKQYRWYTSLTLLGIYGFFSVTREGKPLYGDYEGNFFKAVPIDYIDLLIPENNFSQLWITVAAILLALIIVLLWLRKKKDPAGKIMLLSFGVITALSFLSGKPLPTGRVLIPFWPFVVIGTAEVLEHLKAQNKTHQAIRWVLNGLVCTFLVYNFVQQIDAESLFNNKRNQWQRPLMSMATFEKLDPDETYYLEKDRHHHILEDKLSSVPFKEEKLNGYLLKTYDSLNYYQVSEVKPSAPEKLNASIYIADSLVGRKTIIKLENRSFQYEFVFPSHADRMTINDPENNFSLDLHRE